MSQQNKVENAFAGIDLFQVDGLGLKQQSAEQNTAKYGNDAGFPTGELGVVVRYSGPIPIDNTSAVARDNMKIFNELEKNRLRGAGGAPTRATSLPIEPSERKNFPIASGVLDYFPDAIVAISEISKAGNDQHNPGLPLRWTRSKSGDEADTCIRHFLQRGTIDIDGKRHTAKAAWRMLALLQKEIEQEQDAKV